MRKQKSGVSSNCPRYKPFRNHRVPKAQLADFSGSQGAGGVLSWHTSYSRQESLLVAGCKGDVLWTCEWKETFDFVAGCKHVYWSGSPLKCAWQETLRAFVPSQLHAGPQRPLEIQDILQWGNMNQTGAKEAFSQPGRGILSHPTTDAVRWGYMLLAGPQKAQVISQHAPGNLMYISAALTWKSHPGAESFTPCWSREEVQQKGDGYRLAPGWQQILSAMEGHTPGSMPNQWGTRLPASQPCCWPAKWTWSPGFRFPSIEWGLNWFQSPALPVASNLARWVTFLVLPLSPSEHETAEQVFPTRLGCQHRAWDTATSQCGSCTWRRKWKSWRDKVFKLSCVFQKGRLQSSHRLGKKT